MTEQLQCWRCGEHLPETSGSATVGSVIGRLDQCPACSNYLHVCRMCQFYDPQVAEACREDDAEEVKDKQKANFCDYFKPSSGAFDAQGAAAADKAKSELDALFGDAPAAGDTGNDPAAEDDPLAAARKLFDES